MSVLVGKKAPDFTAKAVLADGSIVDDFSLSKVARDKNALLFFYPKDFTFVCPSELIALDHRHDRFRERQIEVIGVSVDSEYVHNAWRKTPIEEGGIGAVKYSLVSDIKHDIARAYGVENEEGVALRAAFLIDKRGIVRSQIVNDLPLGRNIDELLRLFDALAFHEEHGEVCPAGWQKGQAAMKETPESVAAYLRQNARAL